MNLHEVPCRNRSVISKYWFGNFILFKSKSSQEYLLKGVYATVWAYIDNVRSTKDIFELVQKIHPKLTNNEISKFFKGLKIKGLLTTIDKRSSHDHSADMPTRTSRRTSTWGARCVGCKYWIANMRSLKICFGNSAPPAMIAF